MSGPSPPDPTATDVVPDVVTDVADALTLDGIGKRFGDVAALAGASLRVRRGTVHALLGENGAGKTTLMRIAFGLLRADEGTVRIGGRPVVFSSPAHALRAGIGMVQQHFALVLAMTVAENVALSAVDSSRPASGWRYDAARAADRVRSLSVQTGLVLDPAARVSTLPIGAQQRVEIVKALAGGASLLILDEPTAVLTPSESVELLRWIRAFADAGNSVVLITHKLRDALGTADDITVIRRGVTVLSVRADSATERGLAAAMLGDAGDEGTPDASLASTGLVTQPVGAVPGEPSHTEPVIEARDIAVCDEGGVLRVRNATLRVAAGEVLGVAGIEGAGQRELLRALTGRLPIAHGALVLPRRIGFVPEDRQRDALILDFALYENMALRGAGARRGIVRWRDDERDAAALIAEFDVRAPSARGPARALSGGNQQKLVLAREMPAGRSAGAAEQGSYALVVENPTRGLDIRASAAVHERLRSARAAGAAVILYSSDLDEVLALADRIIVVHAGVVRDVAGDRESVGRAMLGVA